MSGLGKTGTRHRLADRGDDFYATPAVAVDALIKAERAFLPPVIWEPACGDGAIVLPLRAAGYTVHASDLVARGCPDSEARIDFLFPCAVPDGAGGIVTNPPFKLARAFIDTALSRVPYVAMLMRLAFLEGGARRPWFEASPLARVHVSARRLPMMHRGGWEGPAAGSGVAFAWFVWDRRHVARPEIRWFDWRENPLCSHCREAAE